MVSTGKRHSQTRQQRDNAAMAVVNPKYQQADPIDDEARGLRQLVPPFGVSETRPEADDIEDCCTYTCQSCGQDILAQDDFVVLRRVEGVVVRWICVPCNRLKKRLADLRKAQPAVFQGWESLDSEGRKEVYKKAQNLFGNQLSKTINEELITIRRKKVAAKYKESGKWMPVSDAESLPRFVKHPEALKNLRKHGGTFVCSLSGEEHVYVPEYSFEESHEEEHEQTNARTIGGYAKISNPKAVKDKAGVVGEPTKPRALAKGLQAKVATRIFRRHVRCVNVRTD